MHQQEHLQMYQQELIILAQLVLNMTVKAHLEVMPLLMNAEYVKEMVYSKIAAVEVLINLVFQKVIVTAMVIL